MTRLLFNMSHLTIKHLMVMGMNTNPYTITTGAPFLHDLQRDDLQRAQDEKLWNKMSDDEKTQFLAAGMVTWAQSPDIPIRPDNAHIHIGVCGVCRILLHCDYIKESLLTDLCDCVRELTCTTDFDQPQGLDQSLQCQLQRAVESINAVWNSDVQSDVQQKKDFVQNSLKLTNEDIKENFKILSNLITTDGRQFIAEGSSFFFQRAGYHNWAQRGLTRSPTPDSPPAADDGRYY